MNRTIAAIIGAAVSVPLLAQSAVQPTGFLDRIIAVGGNQYRYQVYVPAEYTNTKSWPVIMDLHGNGAQGTDGMKPTARTLAVQVRLDRSRFPVVIVFPQAQPGFKWLYPDMERLAMAELDATTSEFHADPSRIYLTGFSMGATGAYRIAAKWPDRFAAMFVVAGLVETGKTYSARDVEVDRQTNAFEVANNPFDALADRIKKLPIWVAHGDADDSVPVEQSRQLIPALKAAGANVRYTEYPGASHIGAAEKAYGDPDIVQWLLSQRRPAGASLPAQQDPS